MTNYDTNTLRVAADFAESVQTNLSYAATYGFEPLVFDITLADGETMIRFTFKDGQVVLDGSN